MTDCLRRPALVTVILVACLHPGAVADEAVADTPPTFLGLWDVRIECPGGDIEFGLDVQRGQEHAPQGRATDTTDVTDAASLRAFLINGSERIPVPQVRVTDERLTLNIRHYDSVVTLRRESEQLSGQWKKRRGADEWVQLHVTAVPHTATESDDAAAFTGRWSVQFESSEDQAVGIFRQVGQRVDGTFLTTTGDYRFLSGRVHQGQLQLSCFDGGHAFLFRAKAGTDGTLRGDFWSASTWHETWTAQRNEQAELPDSFRQTIAVPTVDADQLKFPDLDGVERSINDPRFAGKARIIYVFGSWCPNCHDAAAWFAELERRFGDQGLSILGLAFELTGDFERDRKQVQRYAERHAAKYPILIAGLSDKADASRRLPILDRVRSYPTTIFLDRNNRIRAVHTGFSGPATGAAHDRLRERFELLITELLDDE